MKKDRNAFFSQEAQFSNMNYYPNNMMPINQAQGSSSFYSGPVVPQNNFNNELESRLSKIERQIQRLDARITKLENMSPSIMQTDDIITNQSMYML